MKNSIIHKLKQHVRG